MVSIECFARARTSGVACRAVHSCHMTNRCAWTASSCSSRKTASPGESPRRSARRRAHVCRSVVPHSATQGEDPDQCFHVGPHIMIVTPNQNDLRAFDKRCGRGCPSIIFLVEAKCSLSFPSVDGMSHLAEGCMSAWLT
jgi:hypothetical protein